MAKAERIHTYLDDIKYQMVKEDNKRTPFYSSELQIVARSKMTIKEIEKSQKLATSEYNRQQQSLVAQRGKLIQAQQCLGLNPASNRRYSAPSTAPFPNHSVNSEKHSIKVCANKNMASRGSMPNTAQKDKISYGSNNFRRGRKPSESSDLEGQKQLLESTERDNLETISRFQNIMSGSGRRATIAEGTIVNGNRIPSL